MQHLEVSGALRPIYGSLGVKRLMTFNWIDKECPQSRDATYRHDDTVKEISLKIDQDTGA